ncbi:MAG: glycosyltransferase family 39 protein [Candidatus Liptonbacteria bacterium]|nr:glycosyltransferase family 39 protein [Candidatus Liptonbacteria bacterium]
MSKRTVFLCLFVILIIASFLRLYHFTTTPPGLYPDEAADGNNALEITHTAPFGSGFKVYYPEDNGREGLYVNMVAVLIKFFDGVHEPWIVRLPAAVSGILTVLGIYFLAAELFSPKVGILSSFLLATSVWHIIFSRIGFRAIMAPLFLIWALYLLLKSIRPSNSKFYILYSIFAGISYGLGFYTYIAYRITPLLLILFVVFFRKEKNFWKIAGIFLATTFIVALPIGLYYLQNPADFFGRTAQISVSNSDSPIKDLALNSLKTLAMFNFRGDFNWRHNISGAPELFWPVGIMFLIGIVISLKLIMKRLKIKNQNDNKKIQNKLPQGNSNILNFDFSFLLLFLWFFLAMLPVVLSDEGIPHALRSIIMLPPAIIFAALGTAALYSWLKSYIRASWVKGFACLFFVLLFAEAYSKYFVVWAKNPDVQNAFNADYVTLGRELNALPAATPKYVVVEAGGVPIRGIPTPAQTTMFITDTFRADEQAAKNIHYVLPHNINTIPKDALIFELR